MICPLNSGKETWDRVLLCDAHESLREWIEKLQRKITKNEKYKHTQEREINVTFEMIKIQKDILEEKRDHTLINNEQINELFRGFVVEKWVMLPQESTYFRSHNEVVIVMCVNLCYECWKK